AGMYAVYHGPDGLRYIANKIHRQTLALAKALEKLGINNRNSSFFDTLEIEVDDTAKLRKIAEGAGVNFHYIDAGTLSLSLNEATTDADLEDLLDLFAQYVGQRNKVSLNTSVETELPESL